MSGISNELRLRRGTKEQHMKFKGSLGEVTVVTTENDAAGACGYYTLSVHDGKTVGGHFLAPMKYVDNKFYTLRDKLRHIDDLLNEEFLSKKEAETLYMSINKKFTEDDFPYLKERIDSLDIDIEQFKNFEKRLASYKNGESGAMLVGYAASEEYFDLRDENIINPDRDEEGNIIPTIIDVQTAIDALASWNKNLAQRIDDGILDQKISEAIDKLIGGAPETLDTLREIANLLGGAEEFIGTIKGKLNLLQRGTVTLNSKEGRIVYFDEYDNLKKFKGKENYTVTVSLPVPKSETGIKFSDIEGTVGEIWIEKGLNYFTIYNSGPAKDIDVDFIILGDEVKVGENND